MRVWTGIVEIWPEGSNLKEMVWRLPFLHSHSSGPWGTIDLDSFKFLRSNWPGFLSYGQTTSRAWWWPQKMAQKSFFSQSYKRSKYSHKMALLSLFFTKRCHYFGFHCFCFQCQDFGRMNEWRYVTLNHYMEGKRCFGPNLSFTNQLQTPSQGPHRRPNNNNQWTHLSSCSLHSDDVALGLVQHLDWDSDNRHFKLVGLFQQFRQLDLKNVSLGHKSFLKKVTLHFTLSLRSS